MKIAFIFGDYLISNRPLNFNKIMEDNRGLTGSEIGVINVAVEMAKRGNDVSLFVTQYEKCSEYLGVKLYNVNQKLEVIDDSFDIAISWCVPDELRDLPKNITKVCCQQLNDFSYSLPDYDDFVDIYTGCSKGQIDYLNSTGQLKSIEKWNLLPNGCYPDSFGKHEKIPGRVIWASSADRGLHLLLQEWQYIKEAVPHANLKIFYNFTFGSLVHYNRQSQPFIPGTHEVAQRARYMLQAINKLKHLDVELAGSVSRNRITQEMDQAEVLAFPVSPIAYTEGFSITILEACAAGSCPLISSADALGELYKGVVPMIEAPVRPKMKEYRELVIKALTDKDFRDETNNKCKAFARNFNWEVIVKNFEEILLKSKKHE